MARQNISEETKLFLQKLLETGEKWLAEEVKKIYDASTDEKDFLEETSLYLTRLEIKIKTLKEECEKLTAL